MTATSPTKRKGRLSSSIQETDDAALKARRERNREAQNIFRRRRQAAEAAQAQRVRRLEQVVEEMSSVFMSFVDEMLTTEAIVSGQPSLVGSLRRSMERILELAHEVVGPEEDLVVLPRSNSPPDENRLTGKSQSPDSERSETNSDSGSSLAVTLRRIQPVQQSQTSALTTALSTSTHSAASNSTSATSISPPTPQFTPLHHFQQPSLGKPVTIPSFTLSPQIFGNGWLGTTPTAPGEVVSTGPQHQSPFSFRVASTALQIACQLLVTSPPEYSMTPQEARLFCNTLKGKAREEMVTRLRWLIGPGKHEMHRVIDLPYGRYGHHVYARGELNPTTMEDIEWPWPTRPAGSRIDHFTRFFSIVGVEKQLLALGARMVDSETLELNLNNSPMPNVSDAVPNKQPESWSFVNCFSFPTQPKNGPVTVRLSIPTLVTSLASRSCCLMRGPGIPRAEIGSAIEEAIIKTG